MNQTIWIARHGNRLDFVNPEWFNTAERPYDPPLSEDGIIQAQELGQRLVAERIRHIFASPFLRTVQTADRVAQILDLPIKIESGLSEWLNPDWMKADPERLPMAVLQEQFPRIDLSYTSRITPNYPETSDRVIARTGETARQLAAEFSDDILLVGHGASVVGAAWGLLSSQEDIKAPLCCLVKLVLKGDKWIVQLNGDTSHLSQSESAIRFK